jgi:hypothetical protein
VARWIVLPVLILPLLAGLFWPLGWTTTVVPDAETPFVPIASRFRVNDCGTITGRVLWDAAVPTAEPILAPPNPRGESGATGPRQLRYNPRLPRISADKGLAHAVVLLRGVDPTRARPWDHPPVRLEVRNDQVTVLQGEERSQIGFVERGQSIEIVSCDPYYHTLSLRGSAFLGIPLADRNQVRQRRLTRAGVVEATSGSGCFWMLANLFVADHPYLTQTDTEGNFTLPGIPSGRYQLVVWHLDWREVSRELDGDSWEIAAIRYRPPLQLLQTVQVQASEVTRVQPTFSKSHITRGGAEPIEVEEAWRDLDREMPLDPHFHDH